MPIYADTWQPSDYVPRRHLHMRDLSINHHAKLKSVKFEFDDYKVYDQLACYPYERMLIHCFNNYGYQGAMKNVECFEIATFLKTCIHTHEFFGRMKQNNPEFFSSNEYSRPRPTFQQLGL